MTSKSLSSAVQDRPATPSRVDAQPARRAPSTEAIPIATPALIGTGHGQLTIAAMAISDIVALVASVALALIVFASLSPTVAAAQPALLLRLAAVVVATHLTLSLTQGLYACVPLSPARELRQWLLVSLLAMLLLVGGVAASAALPIPLIGWLAAAVLLSAVLVPIQRAILRGALGRTRWWGRRVIVVGGGELASRTMNYLLRKPHLGLRPVGFVDDQPTSSAAVDPKLYLGTLSELPELASRTGAFTAVIAADAFDADEMGHLVTQTRSGIQHWLVLPLQDRLPSLWTSAVDVGGRPALSVSNRLASPWRRFLKRSLDLTLTIGGLLLIWPLLATISLLIALTSRGPIFYSQERIGRFGKRFRAWKFRTMLVNADQVLAEHLAADPALREEWLADHKLKNDPRVTWIGRLLRRSSLDELPQIFNVLLGEMSLVGPRPIVEAEIAKYADRFDHYQQVLPGITGLWQISGRNNTTYRERIEFDDFYVNNWSVWLDLYILACTFKVVVLGEGAY